MKLEIIIDSREPSQVLTELQDTINHMNNGVQKNNPIDLTIKRGPLSAGDFECNGIVIERKSFTDFFESIVQRVDGIPRYRAQLVKLVDSKSKGKIPMLAFHGAMTSVDDTKRLAILTVMSKYMASGVPVVGGFPGLKDFCWWMVRTFMYGAKDVKSMEVDISKKVIPVRGSPTRTLVQSIPSVGPKIAGRIEDSGFSTYDLCSLTIPGLSLLISGLPATKENMRRFEKKPYKVAKKIYDFLRGVDSTYDAEEWRTHPEEEGTSA